jgi:hypothetical protein
MALWSFFTKDIAIVTATNVIIVTNSPKKQSVTWFRLSSMKKLWSHFAKQNP